MFLRFCTTLIPAVTQSLLLLLPTTNLTGQGYTISQSGTYNIEIDAPTIFSVSNDDATEIPIGFDFNFFGATYTDCWVGGDGFISFGDYPGGSLCCGQSLPDAQDPNNLIAACWTNMDNTSAHYEVFGTAPFRRLVITLDYRNPCDEVYYGQVKLYESTDVIEIHTQEWAQAQCQGWLATQGIESANGDEAYIVPGRNYNDQWNIIFGNNDFVSFTPGTEAFDYIVEEDDDDYAYEYDFPEDITVYDDEFALIDIGFTFNFFGAAYTSCYASQNGFISFPSPADPGCCEGQLIPNTNAPNGLIAAAWMDAGLQQCCDINDNYYDIISYEVLGTEPDRRLVISFNLAENCSNAYYSGQVKLFEGTDIIEVHTNYFAESSTPCFPVTQGIENSKGTTAFFLDGRNGNTSWNVECCSDVVRFIPETALPQNDAGVSGIESGPFCSGVNDMRVYVDNFGGQTIDSVEVHWEWNGIMQDTVHFFGSMPIGTGNYAIDLEAMNLVFGENYLLKAWTSMPNGVEDEYSFNDTLTANILVGMSGEFTIGGASPDYLSFADAILDMETSGICDTTIFNVRPGTYTEQIELSNINGSLLHPIIFQAENGDSASVIIEYNSNIEDENYVIHFDSLHNTTFRNFTINALGSYYARAIVFSGVSTGNTIESCNITGRNNTGSDTEHACIYSHDYNHNNRFLYNTVRYGSTGFYHQYHDPDIIIGLQGGGASRGGGGGGGGDEPVENLIFIGNHFIDFYNRGIYIYHSKNAQIHFNSLTSSNPNIRGIDIETDTDSLSISNNHIYLSSGTYGMELSDITPGAGKRASVFNNFINVPGSGCQAGVGLFNCNDVDFFHNTARISTNTSGRYALDVVGGNRDTLYNNVLANFGGGAAVYTSFIFNNDFNYNNYHVTGNVIGHYNGDRASLMEWQNATGYDEASWDVDPLFASSTDLHTSNSYLNGAGDPAHSLPLDIDGEPRNTEAPDIGADEFVPVSTDLAITELLSPSLVCNAEQNISIVLMNTGSDTIHNAIIQWTLNGISQPDFLFQETLLPEGDTAQVTLSTYVFSSDQADTLLIWVDMVNGSGDLQPQNDSLYRRYRLPLNGNYTIGGADPDFETIGAATADLAEYQTCGPVLFQLRSGVYNEQVFLDSVPTASAVNTITFESESQDSSDVIIEFTPFNTQSYVWLVNGTDYLTLRHLTIKALPSSNSDCIDIRHGADHVTISNCYLEGYHFSFYSSVLIKLVNVGKVNHHLTIRNNRFVNGITGVIVYHGSQRSENLIIENNRFLNQKTYALDITALNGLTIRKNHISTNFNNNFYKGIDLNSTKEEVEISGNIIDVTNGGDGMFLDGMNFGTNIGSAHIYNNMVKTDGDGHGIAIWNSESVKVNFNSVNCLGSGYGIEIVGGGDSIDVVNNIAVSNSGRALRIGVFGNQINSDYNDLYTISGYVGSVGWFPDTLYATLPEWQAGAGLDSHSMSVDPEFIAINDLHVLADTLDGAGIPVPDVSQDLDGNPRNSLMPDIGADEIGANPDDAGVIALLPEMPFARGPQDIVGIIRNYGGNTITSVDIDWELNGVAQPVFHYTGELASLQQDTLILGSVDFLLNTPYVIQSWTTAPNGNTDLYNLNDTLTTSSLYAAVSDTVTIGGASPVVPSIAAAIQALSLGGVLDSVHFQLRPGTYHHALILPQTFGMSCNTPIIFESETGDADDVIWDNLGLTSHTILLDGADGVTFQNLTIKSVLLPYHAIEFRNGSICNVFRDCLIENIPTTSSSTSQAVVYSIGSNNHNNKLLNNIIRNGAYGLYWGGEYSGTGAVISGNVFENAYYQGCTVWRQIAPIVSGNIVETNSSTGYFYGIHLSECQLGTQITGNEIRLPGKRGVGILAAFTNGSPSVHNLIANNFVNIGAGHNSYGIQHHYCHWSDVYFNTIRLTGGFNSGYPYYRAYAENVRLRNNIFDNRADGVAMLIGGNEGPLDSDYNDLYTTGSVLVHQAGTNYADLQAWQATGQDSASIVEDPMYLDEFGYAITSAALNAVAVPLAEVVADIEGELRDTLPDIGCDEFYLASDDVGIISINYPVEPFPSGENTVYIKFVNNGQDTLVSMQVDWEVDSIPQPTYLWTGLLPSAGTYDSLDIGIFDFEPYRTHTIKVWVSHPNEVPDGLASNDTLVASDLYPALSGIYTIGGNEPDFDSIYLAIDALNKGGAFGSVTFNIRTGTYLETLLIEDFPGSDCHVPVIFQSASGDSTDVILTNLGIDDHVLRLDGADGVIFQHLTLRSVHPVYRTVVQLLNGAHCNQIQYCKLDGYEAPSTDINHAVVRFFNTLDTANQLRYNHISHGAAGCYLQSNGSQTHTVIENNFLDRQYYYGIYASGESGIHINSNRITGSDYSHYHGIYLENCSGDVEIMLNDIHSISSNNLVRLESCVATTNQPGRIINNFISTTGSVGTSGLMINNCQYYDIYHNNIHVNSTAGSTGLYCHGDANLSLYNNVIANTGSGNAINGNNQSNFSSDYNDIYCTAGLGVWNNVALNDLEAWQNASLQDTHSLSVNPQYMSDFNLHVSNILLNGTGISLPGVTIDFDGSIRDIMPDIGADEFDPSIANDAGIFGYYGPNAPFAHGNQPVQVTLKNYGYETLTAVDVRWLVNGIEQPVYHWTGSLSSAQCDTITVGIFSFGEFDEHDFVFWTEDPNNVPDSTLINDTLAIENKYPALNGTYTVGGVLPDFNVFTQIQNSLNMGGILGDVTFDIREGTYSTQFIIRNFPRTNYEHTVTFQSEDRDSSAVVITKNFYAPLTNYTILLDDAHNIHFRDLTLASTQGRVLNIANGSSRIELSNNILRGADLSTHTFSHQIIFSETTTEDSVSIKNNFFENGEYGIFLQGSGGALEKELLIENNQFHNCLNRSIYTHNHDGLTIRRNTVYNDEHPHDGIFIIAAANTKEISQNDIRLLAGGSYGLYMHYLSGNETTSAVIANNYILIKNWGGASYGMLHSQGNYNLIQYNTARVENTHPQSVAFYDESGYHNIHVRNCIFANYSGGFAVRNNWYNGYATNTMDHCNLYTSGDNLAQYGGIYANLAALQAGQPANNQNSVSAEPLFSGDGYEIYQAACDGGAVTVPVTYDITGQVRDGSNPDIGCDEFTLPPHDIGARLLINPETYCGLSNEEEVTMRIQNYGANAETGFDVAYSLNGSAWHVENVGALSVTPGGTLDYTFTTFEDLSQPGLYAFKLRTSLETDSNLSNDTLHNILVEHIPALITGVSNMVPYDDAIDIDRPVSLSWNPAPHATAYDIYIWPSSQMQPVEPVITDIVSINTSYHAVDYGTTYSWQVIAKNSCGQTVPSPIQEFTIRLLPDLVVDSISAPSMAVSEQQIQIEWQVKNMGTGHTQNTPWTDAVYLSLDATLNTSFDTYLGGVQNLTALQPGESYLQTGTFTIPQGFTGNYYVFVYADRYGNLIESTDNNNWDRTATQMQITLVPPPDLVIDQIVVPATAFSGTTITVQYTARNNGTGGVPANATWKDRVKLSADGDSNAGGTVLVTLSNQGPLAVDETYNRSVMVTLPNAIFGDYYIYVETDIHNQVYEQAAENNNHSRSDTMDIILTPPPNLVPIDLVVPDTMHSHALIQFDWTVENAGGSSPPEPYWYDFLYLSPSPVYNPNFLSQILAQVRYSPLNPGNTYNHIAGARVPVVNEGLYYIYIYTDRYGYVFEHTFENDNISRFGPFAVVNPDVAPGLDSIPLNGESGDIISVQWYLHNNGPGNIHDRSFKYTYYLSVDTAFVPNNAIEIKTTNTSPLTIAAGDSLLVESTLALPLGLNDQYYVYVSAQPHTLMHEHQDAYANNLDRSANAIDIDPGPYPDLITSEISVPDTITAGETISFQYEEFNQGGADASTRGVEAIYISFEDTWQPQFAQLLSEVTYSSQLKEDSAVSVTRSLTIPANINSNLYYFYVITDKSNTVFEYSGESNNVFRSDPVFIKPYPPVDLAVESVSVADDTLQSGNTYNIGYVLASLEATPTRNNWNDAIYLSVDSIFDEALDILVSLHEVQTPDLMTGDTFAVTVPAFVPHGTQGDYYIVIRADAEDVHNDVELSNNINVLRNAVGQAIRVRINLSPYPDLMVSAIQAPGTAVAGQQVAVAYSIGNLGTATAATWQDRIYLSADGVISHGDLLLHTGRIDIPLVSGNTVTDTASIDLPGYLSGNYYLIIRTDYLNELYEHTGESNNNTSIVLQITEPPPSDLMVDVISLADSLLAGDFTTISWTTRNQGSFPAQGSVREIVYLSSDTTWNVEDQVFGVVQNPVYLPPQATHTDSVTAPVIGVINQNYYALIRTDAIDNVNESNEENNISSSLDPAYVDVKTLFIDSLTTDSLRAGVELYYKLIVDPTLEGESILVTLQGDSSDAYNELFISFDDAPTRGDYDISNNKPLSGSQQAVIRDAQVGTYYILAYGSTQQADDQQITLFARVMSYEILAVTPARGSNTGMVTVVIDGSRLDSTYNVRLHVNDSIGFVTQADTFIIVSPEKIIARFDLRGTPPGFYNVECQIEPYFIAVLENGFEVFEGMGPDLQVNWFLVPGATSPRNKPIKIIVEMINNGDADVENKFVRVSSPYGNVMAASYEELLAENTFPYYDIPVQLQNGFDHVLPPGNSVMYEVFSWLAPFPFFIIDVR